MIKKTVFIIGLLLFQSLLSISVQNIELPGSRIRNLVICNNKSEFYTLDNSFNLPWNNYNDNTTISKELLEALCSKQLTLCTKSLWHNVQFIGQLWHDFATKPSEFIISKYKNFSNQSTAEFTQSLDTYQPAIQEIHKLYIIVNGIISQNSSKDLSQISHQINLAMNAFYKENLAWITNKNLKNFLQNIFTLYTLYEITLANNYVCKEITDTYILFIPQDLINQTTIDSKIISTTNQSNINPSDINLGLRYEQYSTYDYRSTLNEQKTKQLTETLKKTHDLGPLLLQVLENIVIKKSMLKKDFQDYGSEILPLFNIFLSGHGSSIPIKKFGYIYQDSVTAEISIEQKQRTKTYKAVSKKTGKEETKQYTYKSSDFLDILNFFNNQLFVKTLTIFSCYPGGKKISYEFDISSKLNNLNLEKLTYPIMLIGSTFAPVSSFSFLTPLLPVKNINLSDCIYLQQHKYGPNKIDGQEKFVRFFNFLNQTKTYEKFKDRDKNKEVQHYRIQDPTKKLPSTETFTSQHTSFVHAANVFAHIYDDSTQKMKADMLYNYILIKFPHTSWFTPARFKKQVLKLSQIAALSKESIFVSKETEAILVDANIIPASIIFQHQPIPPFIPIHYLNQNYVFESISIQHSIPLEQFIKQFFTIEGIQEPINLIIKNLSIGSKTYTNVYIFIFNNFGSQGTRNGYLCTEPSGATTMTHWPSNQPFGTQQISQTFDNTEALKLIGSVIKNSQKPNNTSEEPSKVSPRYETDTRSTAGSNIKNLHDTISHLKTQNIAKLQQKKERDAQNEPKEKRPVHESQAAKNAAKKGQQPDPRNTLITALELANLLQ